MVLGRLYEDGIGTKRDLKKALYYYGNAANELEPYAIYKIGMFCEQGQHPTCVDRKPNRKQAFNCFKQAVNDGNPEVENAFKEAQFKIGQYYQFAYDNVVEKNLQFAIRNYESAAHDGHIEAMNSLGSLFFNELKEYEQAAHWFKKAAERGFTRAVNNLGICYEFGYGVDRDWDLAIKLYQEGTEKGFIQSIYNLGYLYFQSAM